MNDLAATPGVKGAGKEEKISVREVAKKALLQHYTPACVITDSLNYMRAQQWIRLHVFVVMPNHVHLIVRFLADHTLSDVMRNFKKHTAKQVICQYQAENNDKSLEFLKRAASHIPNQKYKVWEDGYDARDVFSPGFLRQKAEYIHNNPCRPHWELVEHPEAYLWSSARYYLLGKPAIIAVDDVSEWLV